MGGLVRRTRIIGKVAERFHVPVVRSRGYAFSFDARSNDHLALIEISSVVPTIQFRRHGFVARGSLVRCFDGGYGGQPSDAGLGRTREGP